MRYAQIDNFDIVNGNDVGISLYVQGCEIRCPHCFNKETGDFNAGRKGTDLEKTQIYKLLEPSHIKRLSILGGEPLDIRNIGELFLLCCEVKERYPNKEIGLGSGYTGEQIQDRIRIAKEAWPQTTKDSCLYGLLSQVDYLIAGPFIQKEKDLTLKWRGSRNQEVILCKESIKADRKILYKHY